MPNFDLLQSIQPPQVVGSLPAAPPQTGLDSLAGGLLQGLQAGQNMQAQRLGMDATRQQMDQSKQLFPGQLKGQELANQGAQLSNQKAQLDIESAQIDFSDKKAARAKLQQMQAEFSKSYADGVKFLMQKDPVSGIKMQQDFATMQESQAKAAASMADTRTKQQDALYNIQQGAGNLASTSAGLATDQKTGQIDWNKANQVYQQQLSGIKKQAPQLAEVYPDKLDQGSYLSLMKIGHDAHMNQLQKEIDKAKATEKTEDPAIKKTVDYIQSLKEAVDAAPSNSPEREKAIDRLNFAITQAKTQDKSIWESVKDFFIGSPSYVSPSNKETATPSPQPEQSKPNSDREAAIMELKRRGVL